MKMPGEFVRWNEQETKPSGGMTMTKAPFCAGVILAALCIALLLPACALAQSALVDNGSDPESRLHLRAKPSKDAASLGKFYSGTPVEILGEAEDGFALVAIGSGDAPLTGYMMNAYLKNADAQVLDATCEMQVISPYGTPAVVLRDAPSNSYDALAMLAVGDTVRRIGVSGDFYYVLLSDGTVGCLASNELK